MAPATIQYDGRDARVKAVLDFARSLTGHIAERGADAVDLRELDTYIRQLPLEATLIAEHAGRLDAAGTELWNHATRFRSGRVSDQTSTAGVPAEDAGQAAGTAKAACHTRAFAFFLLDSSWQSTARVERRAHDRGASGRLRPTTLRIARVSIKAAKTCLEQGELGLCLRIVECAAVYAGELETAGADDDEDDARLARRLQAEYYVLRTALAWKQDRLDVAEHMYMQASVGETISDAVASQGLADVLFAIGKKLSEERNSEDAVRWLHRALAALDIPESKSLSTEVGELRINIVQSLVCAHIDVNTQEARKKAENLIRMVEAEHPDKPILLLLKLELLLSSEKADAACYHDILSSMIRSLVLTTKNIRTIMFHVSRLKDLDRNLAGNILELLLESRLLADPEGKGDLIENALITRILIGISPAEDAAAPSDLTAVLDRLYSAFRQPASEAVTHAAQTLLWRQVELAFNQSRYEAGQTWCDLALHRMFENCGDMNRAKITRKYLQCCLGRGDTAKARQLYFSMSETSRDAPLTRYLMYRVALRDDDNDFAAEHFEVVCKGSRADSSLLFACALDAQEAGNKSQAIRAIRNILERYNGHTPKGVHLPTLLRCMIKLLLGGTPTDTGPTEGTMQELCQIFESVVQKISEPQVRKGLAANEFDVKELEWFSRTSYNLAVEHCSAARPTHVATLTASSAAIIEVLLNSNPTANVADLQLRQSDCHWLGACSHTAAGRAEDSTNTSLEHYRSVGDCGTAFRKLMPKLLDHGSLGAESEEDLVKKHFQVIKFELEAALRLCCWNEMDVLFEECWKHKNQKQWEDLADIVLLIHSHMVEVKLDQGYLTKTFDALRKVVSRACSDKGADTVLLARWLRCLFQIGVSFDDSIGVKCMDEALHVAQLRHGSSSAYPSEELEWLATTGFNRAIDYYCAGDDATTRLWAEKALTLSAALQDGGGLHRLLQKKYSELSWEQVD